MPPQLALNLDSDICSVIRHVNLRSNKIGTDGALAVARSLKGNTNVEVIV